MSAKSNKIMLNTMIGIYLGLFCAFLIANFCCIKLFVQSETGARDVILFISWIMAFIVMAVMFMLLLWGQRYTTINISAINTTILLIDAFCYALMSQFAFLGVLIGLVVYSFVLLFMPVLEIENDGKPTKPAIEPEKEQKPEKVEVQEQTADKAVVVVKPVVVINQTEPEKKEKEPEKAKPAKMKKAAPKKTVAKKPAAKKPAAKKAPAKKTAAKPASKKPAAKKAPAKKAPAKAASKTEAKVVAKKPAAKKPAVKKAAAKKPAAKKPAAKKPAAKKPAAKQPETFNNTTVIKKLKTLKDLNENKVITDKQYQDEVMKVADKV